MILVIGTTTVDLLISGFDRLPHIEGDEFTVDSLVFCRAPLVTMLGGNGANSAYALAALGASTALCSAIGLDSMGQIVEAWLDAFRVDTSCLVRSTTHATATTTMLLDTHKNRLSFHHPGPSFSFGPENLSEDLLKGVDAILITGYPLLRSWRPDGVLHVLSTAQTQGIVTALDIGPAIEPPAVLDELRPLLSYVDYLLGNTYELGICSGTADLDEGVHKLFAAGAQCIIAKCGDEGAMICRRNKELSRVPGFPAEVPFTVGAGDGFNAGFLFALSKSMDIDSAVQFANATAALVVRSGRGVLGSPTHEDVESLLIQT